MARDDDARGRKGTSLAKAPVGLAGAILLAYGITALIFAGHGFGTDAISGTVHGERWLGIEVNGWSSLLFVGAGVLLLLGAPLHWGAKSLALIVGVALGAASVIAIVDGEDVFGVFAANGPTELAWGAAAVVLLLLAVLPRVGARRADRDDRRDAEIAELHRREAGEDRAGRIESDGGAVRARNRELR